MSDIIEVIKPLTRIIEVVERGPQGASNPQIIVQPLKFIMGSTISFPVSDDLDSPSFLEGTLLEQSSVGVEHNGDDGSIRNVTGRIIDQTYGTISFQPERTSDGGGGTSLLYLWTERSMDGVMWNINPYSLRSMEIPNNGESFKTSISGVNGWNDGEYVRFRMATSSGRILNIISPSIISGGEVINGYSVAWELFEIR